VQCVSVTGPRHLWSGDWLRDSAATRERLARGREEAGPADGATDAPSPATPESHPLARLRRTARSALAALWQGALRPRRRRGDAPDRTVASGLRWPRLLALALIAAVVGGAVEVALAGGESNTPGASATSHGWLGVQSGAQPGQTGAVVGFVVPGGPADQAGLSPGDVITSVNGRSIAGPADLASAIGGMRTGERATLQVDRAGQQVVIEVTLGRRPTGVP
jgi:hypothetical protein